MVGEAQKAEVVLDCHELNHSGEMRAMSNSEDRHALAQQLVAGGAAAVAMGFQAMVNPGAAEVQAKLTDAVREAGGVAPVDRDLQALLEKLRSARPQAEGVVEDLVAALGHSTRLAAAPSTRHPRRHAGAEIRACAARHHPEMIRARIKL